MLFVDTWRHSMVAGRRLGNSQAQYLRENMETIDENVTKESGSTQEVLPNIWSLLTHWSRVTHICVGNLAIIGSDNGLSPGRRQAII